MGAKITRTRPSPKGLARAASLEPPLRALPTTRHWSAPSSKSSLPIQPSLRLIRSSWSTPSILEAAPLQSSTCATFYNTIALSENACHMASRAFAPLFAAPSCWRAWAAAAISPPAGVWMISSSPFPTRRRDRRSHWPLADNANSARSFASLRKSCGSSNGPNPTCFLCRTSSSVRFFNAVDSAPWALANAALAVISPPSLPNNATPSEWLARASSVVRIRQNASRQAFGPPLRQSACPLRNHGAVLCPLAHQCPLV